MEGGPWVLTKASVACNILHVKCYLIGRDRFASGIIQGKRNGPACDRVANLKVERNPSRM
jgi:hypothetical protein